MNIDYHDGEELLSGVARWFARAERNERIAAEAENASESIRNLFKHWAFGADANDCQSCGKAESVFDAIEERINEALWDLREELDK